MLGNKYAVGQTHNRGIKHTAEARANMSASNWLRGKKHKEETKRKISLAHMGRPFTDELRIGQQVAYAKRRELASGHPDWRKCCMCKEYDAPENLYISKVGGCWHKKCRNEREREKDRIKRLSSNKPTK